MQVQAPKFRYEITLNTVIVLIGFVVGAVGWGTSWGRLNTSVEQMAAKYDAWIAAHELLHKERQAAIAANEARMDQRFITIEAALRKMENIEYRLTLQEQGSANLGKSVDELKASVNDLGGDLRVMREILERLDPRLRAGPAP